MNVSYNSLNLPEEVTMGNKTIEYIYDGESNLLAKEVEVNGQHLYDQAYIGNLVYEDGAAGASLQLVPLLLMSCTHRNPKFYIFACMGRKHKFYNPEGIYFVSFATVYWLDIFVREPYFIAFIESLEYSRINKGLELFGYCILPSHVHLIIRDRNHNPGKLLKEIKTFTSKKLQHLIQENPIESRKEWLLWMMERAGRKNSNVKNRQFWQQHNKPIELWSSEAVEQKLNYIHNNPVESGFVEEPQHWKYSSAANYANEPGVIEIDFV